MKTNSLIATALAGAVVLSAGIAGAAEHSCAQVVAQECAAAGMAETDVEKILYTVNSDGNNNNRGWLAWVQPKGQQGYFIVDTYPDCRLRQVYTRGGLTLPGVKTF